MNQILQHLNEPEYMHVLINPMPVYGLSMGVVAMIVALFYRRRPVIVAALILIFLAGLSAWPTYHYGQAAYDRVKSMSDTVGGQWLDEHMARAEKLIYAFYVLAAVGVAGIFAPLKWPRTSTPLAVSALVLAIGTLGVGGWISYPAGHVRHKEFRFEPPPGKHEEAEHHHHDEGTASPSPMEHESHGQMQQPAGSEPAMTEEERKKLEESRLQLEASRMQLEASRKQLEAAGVSPTPASSPTSSPAEQQPHDHDHP